MLRVLVDHKDPTSNTILAGTDIGVFRSADGGKTWHNFNQGFPVCHWALDNIPPVPVTDPGQNDRGTVYAATYGHGVYIFCNHDPGDRYLWPY